MSKQFEITQTEVEQGHTTKYKRTCTITEGRQVERWYRNSQLTSSGSYPAHTDYAKSRLVGMTPVN